MRRSTFFALVVGGLLGLGARFAMAQPADPNNPRFRNATITNSASVGNDLTVGDDLTVTDTLKVAVVDAGVLNVEGQARVAGGIIGSARVSAGTASIVGTGGSTFIQTYPGFSNLLSINESTFYVTTYGKVLLSSNAGSCTLNGGSPSTCTATVTASAKCGCFGTGTTAAAAIAVAASVATTTLTCTGANGLTNVVNYICDR